MEFAPYSSLPQLHERSICTNAAQARKSLDSLLEELRTRQQVLSDTGFNNLIEAKRAGLTTLPWLVVVADELADLIQEAPDLEQTLVRIAQTGRAVGMHLVLATQRPDAKTFSGLLRSNAPSRIALKVAKSTDSQIILGEPGAERLLGKGDMLVQISGSTIVRAQGFNLTLDSIKRAVLELGGSH
jgi:S-DNA-T family DNA segregation ATPase FtsK/SpoIIIE